MTNRRLKASIERKINRELTEEELGAAIMVRLSAPHHWYARRIRKAMTEAFLAQTELG
jgi:hypothetical protein